MTTIYCDVHVLGGLLLDCTAELAPPEPDVGIFNWWLDDFALFWHTGNRYKRREVPQKIYDRLTEDDKEAIRLAALDAYDGGSYYATYTTAGAGTRVEPR